MTYIYVKGYRSIYVDVYFLKNDKKSSASVLVIKYVCMYVHHDVLMFVSVINQYMYEIELYKGHIYVTAMRG